tara:strand:+ start:240 stop:548 length:309 start_codon:yes stop_codon:yes gene_type:complete
MMFGLKIPKKGKKEVDPESLIGASREIVEGWGVLRRVGNDYFFLDYYLDEQNAFICAKKRANNFREESVYVVTRVFNTDKSVSKENLGIKYVASDWELGVEK